MKRRAAQLSNKIMASYQHKFTVFTPSYNRSHTLIRVYESLQSQTFTDFEWLIIDDGSSDGSADLIKGWKKESTFPIRYFYQDNAGKHVAFNRGVKEAQGELFLTADSDDAFKATALERFLFHWETIPEDEKAGFSAVTALCEDQHGDVIGDFFPEDVFDSDTLEITYKYKAKGEKWGFHRRDVLKKYPFPERQGQKFVPESVVWNRIARDYKTRFVNEALRIYYHDAGAQLTQKSVFSRTETREYYAFFIDADIDWFRYSPAQFIKNAISYTRLSLLAGDSLFEQCSRLHVPGAKVLWLFSLIPGYCISRYDLWREARPGTGEQ